MRVLLALLLLPSVGVAVSEQAKNVIPLAAEPHHHRLLHNDYVNVYRVQVDPHGAVALHRHDFDAISVMLKDAVVTVYTPGRPPDHRALGRGQIRLQPRGYIHSTTIEGDQDYRNITVELLLPQKGERNLCSKAIADQILHCPQVKAMDNGRTMVQPQFESDETTVNLVTLLPHTRFTTVEADYPELIIAVEGSLIEERRGERLPKFLDSGDFVWVGNAKFRQSVKNDSENTSRFVELTFRPQ